jgi:hypothetical protein
VKSHVALMFLYAVATAAFFALLWRDGRRERLRLFAIIFCSLFLGAIALGWLMYGLPRSKHPERRSERLHRSRRSEGSGEPSRRVREASGSPQVAALTSPEGSLDPSLRLGRSRPALHSGFENL